TAFWAAAGGAKVVKGFIVPGQGVHIVIGILEVGMGLFLLAPTGKALRLSAAMTACAASALLAWNIVFPVSGSSCNCFGAFEIPYRLKLVLVGFATSLSWLVLFQAPINAIPVPR